MVIAPKWGLNRLRARVTADILARNYEAAKGGRRTEGWARPGTDVNAASKGALLLLRVYARDLVRNNAWARRGLKVITNNGVGWGLTANPGGDPERTRPLAEAWDRWAGSTQCDADGRLTFSGIQSQALRTVAESGEVLVRRRWRRPGDGLDLPFQLQLLEPDFLDTGKDGVINPDTGGTILQGVEFDQLGRRIGYWLFEEHPGSGRSSISSISSTSRRVDAADIAHVFAMERPGQIRGVSWFASVIVNMKDLDEFEDAELVRQKVAACFTGYVIDEDGQALPIGEKKADDDRIEGFEPGMIHYLPPGKSITFASPPQINGYEPFTAAQLRRAAAGLGVPFEELTGDYSKVNFSSARMARLSHWSNVYDWRWNMLVPLLCDRAWGWAAEAAALSGIAGENPGVTWSEPPMPMIEPDKEGLALSRLVRAGVMTHDDMIRQQGADPRTHWPKYAACLDVLDKHGIKLDSDVRAVSQAGLTQERAGAKPAAGSGDDTGDTTDDTDDTAGDG